MENFEIVLEKKTTGEAVVTAKDLNVIIGINEGNITIEGNQVSVLASDREVYGRLPITSVRLAENEQLIPTLSGPAKVKAEQKQAIWGAFLEAIKPELETALKANYELENPVL